MKKFLLRLLLGADELVERTLEVISVRRSAIESSLRKKSLEEALTKEKHTLTVLVGQYQESRLALEAAYTLDID
jgi:hypothetical protein